MEKFVNNDQLIPDKDVAVYNALHNVFINGTYSTIAINGILKHFKSDAPYITKLFYGVLDKSIQFDYIISTHTTRKPQQSVIIIIKMGLYQMYYMDTPVYAAVDKTVNLCKQVGKSGISGFVNAILRKCEILSLPTKDDLDIFTYLSVVFSFPKWAIQKLAKQYDISFVESFLSARIPQETHIRANLSKISNSEFYSLISSSGFEKKTDFGYYVTHNQMAQLKNNSYIIQSLPSIIAINSLLRNLNIKNALDLCAAPGGKAVLINQLTNADITACDLYPHRVSLIEKYVAKLNIKNIKIQVNDARDYNIEWIDKFDFVLCDVPCSNFGVTTSKPDIFLNKTNSDVDGLKKLQYQILDTASYYVKKGGYLAYSTCTIFKDENEEIIDKFLTEHNDFTLDKLDDKYTIDGMLKLLPQKDNCGAFFAARLRRS